MPLDDDQLRRLDAFVRLLERWGAVHNLTAIRGENVLTHHLLDSLAVVPRLRQVTGGASARVLDAGSGAGLPGMALAIALPELRFTLADAVQKKCAFMTQARVEVGLANVEVVHGRLEALRLPPFQVIVARALATLAQLVGWTRHLLAHDGCWLAMKGQRPEEELAALPEGVAATVHELLVPGLPEQRHLIEVRLA